MRESSVVLGVVTPVQEAVEEAVHGRVSEFVGLVSSEMEASSDKTWQVS